VKKSLAEIAMGAAVLAAAAGFLVYAISHSGRGGGSGGYLLTAAFDRIDGLPQGADVRVSGVRVGTVESQALNFETFQAVLTLRVDGRVKLPEDSSAEIQSESLLGGKFVALVPGGAEKMLPPGSRIRLTASSLNMEQLIGRFVFGTAPGGGAPAPGQGSEAPSPSPPPTSSGIRPLAPPGG
jgi:phospholipid/cholesterol/gamma-HCH transport system substrate-binding protein